MDPQEIENRFTFHPATPQQSGLYERLREGGLKLAELINELCPDSNAKAGAIGAVDQAVIMANASIARHRPPATDGPMCRCGRAATFINHRNRAFCLRCHQADEAGMSAAADVDQAAEPAQFQACPHGCSDAWGPLPAGHPASDGDVDEEDGPINPADLLQGLGLLAMVTQLVVPRRRRR